MMTRTTMDPTVTRRTVLGTSLGAGVALATGCQFQDAGGEDGLKRITSVQLVGNIDTLDPHVVNNGTRIVCAALLEGLVMQSDEGTDVVPGAAESWEVSDDGLVHTFHMRQGATWSNGDPVTAEDAEWSFQRLISPTAALGGGSEGTSAYRPSLNIKGADAFHSGATKDWDTVGVNAIDDDTLEITLESPNPDFLLSLTHNSMVLLHPATLEAEPTKWQTPEHWVGNGAFTLSVWEQNSQIVVDKNPKYWDAESVKVDQVVRRLGGDSPTHLVAYRAGELDVTSVGRSQVQTMKRDDDELVSQLKTVDGWVSFYIRAMWGGHPAIQDQRVRQAISLGIDRTAFPDVVATQPGVSLIPDVVEGWDERLAVAYDPDAAKAKLSDAGLDAMPPIRIQFPADEAWLSVLAEQLKETFDSTVSIDVVESGVHAETRFARFEDETTMSFFGGTLGGIPTLNTWVFDNAGPEWVMQTSLKWADWDKIRKLQTDKGLDGPEQSAQIDKILQNGASPEAKEFVAEVNRAREIRDEQQRNEAFLNAAKIREDIAQTIPVQWGSLNWLVADYVDGVHVRPSTEGYYCKFLELNQ